MAILFFEGFNTLNTDSTPHLDPRYWSRPLENVPLLGTSHTQNDSVENNTDASVIAYGTYRSLSLSGYRLDTIPPQFPVPLQLSNISGLNSDQLYIAFRVAGLSHSHKYGATSVFPHTTKFITLCSGTQELLAFDIVKTSGTSVQYGTWDNSNGYGLGISVKQTGINGMKQIGLFDLRVDGINSYDIFDRDKGNYDPIIIASRNYFGDPQTRYVHLEFFLNRQTNSVRMKVEGFDVLNRASRQPFGPIATGTSLGIFDNIKFYNKGVYSSNSYSDNQFNKGNFTFDDLAISNHSGDAPNTWMGPNTRILHISQAAKTIPPTGGWNTSYSVPGMSPHQVLDQNDGDNSYISSDVSGSIYANNLTFYNQYLNGYFSAIDSIGGIKIFNSVRKTFLDSDFINVYGIGDPSDPNNYVDIGETYTVENSNYNTIISPIITKDPSTNLPWTTGTFFTYDDNLNVVITSGYFGVKKL